MAAMAVARPTAVFPQLSESFGHISYTKEGRMVLSDQTQARITSLKLENYSRLANRITII